MKLEQSTIYWCTYCNEIVNLYAFIFDKNGIHKKYKNSLTLSYQIKIIALKVQQFLFFLNKI